VQPEQHRSEQPQLAAFRDTLKDGAVEPEMVAIPAGEFQMGCVSHKGCNDEELPVRTVTFEEPFAMGKHEVTFGEYDRFAEATGREKAGDGGWGRGERPVIDVSWDDAQAYVFWLSEQTGKRYRLPSEAEWEYAARGGTTTNYWWGDDIQRDGKVWANCYGCGSEWDGVQTTPVGSFPENPFGLYDTAGNVWEWVQDCWHDSYEGAPDDGSAWEESKGGNCGRRVARGGSWNDKPEDLRSANRNWSNTVYRSNDLGFRLAQDL